MKHEDVWRAIDTLAAENGLSASGLAKRSGLDATTFNPSKRTHAGRPGALAEHRERGEGAGCDRRVARKLHLAGLRRPGAGQRFAAERRCPAACR